MKKNSLSIFILFLISSISFAAVEMKYGSLNVFSKMPKTIIFVDGTNKGTESVLIKEIQAGTHFVKVTLDGTGETVVYAEVIEVKAGEVTTIYIDEKGKEQSSKKSSNAEEVDVFRTKKIIDYSKEMHTGWHIRLGYLSNLYYSYDSPSLDNYASTFDLGIGFKLPISQGIDFSLELERAELTASSNQWYFMPLTANIILSYLPSPYFRGKQYFGLGIGYYMTDLETEFKQNLSTLGYHLFYGLEMPASEKSAYFFEFGYHMAEISRYSYSLNTAYASVGYRWDVFQ